MFDSMRTASWVAACSYLTIAAVQFFAMDSIESLEKNKRDRSQNCVKYPFLG